MVIKLESDPVQLKSDQSLAARFVKLEMELNKIQFLDSPIGGLLSKFHGIHKAGRDHTRKVTWLFVAAILIKFISKGFFRSDFEVKGNKGANILLSKLADKHHCNALIDPLKDAFFSSSLLYTPGDGNEIWPYAFPKKVNLRRLWKSSLFLRHNWKRINSAYEHFNLRISRPGLYSTLFFQLIALQSWLDFFKQSNIRLVVVDFDRDTHNAPLILAAQQSDIKTVSLVHGVITTEYGYTPVVADEIWCWSEFQKNQLNSGIVDHSKVKVVGSPIAQCFDLKNRRDVNPPTIRVGIGLNPVGQQQNKAFVNHLLNEMATGLCWEIKLHPSMQREGWMKELEREGIRIYEKDEIDLAGYFELIDLLVVGNSGIGFEAILNSVPVWVYRVTEQGFGNDLVMIEQAGCPDISKQGNYYRELTSLLNEPYYLDELLKTERAFVVNDFYAKTGLEATAEIIHNINIALKNAI